MLDESIDGFIYVMGLLTTVLLTGGTLTLAGYGALQLLG